MATDEERLEQIKEWWQENRWIIIGGLSLGLSAIVGYNGWAQYTKSQEEAVSSIYEQISEATVEQRIDEAIDLIAELTKEYPTTGYAGKAALIQARIEYERGEVEKSREALQWAIDNATEASTVHTARLRLAFQMLGDGEYQQALNLLDVTAMDGFASHYNELRGDAQRGLGNIDKAHEAYLAAVETLGENSSYKPILDLKVNGTRMQEN